MNEREVAKRERQRIIVNIRQWSIETGSISAAATNAVIDFIIADAPPDVADDENGSEDTCSQKS